MRFFRLLRFIASVCLAALGAGATLVQADDTVFTLSLQHIGEPFLGQRPALGFSGDYAATASVAGARGPLAFELRLGIDEAYSGVLLDGSFLEYRAGPWAFGIGAPERSWGPSRHASLVLSRNARPVPGAYLRRDSQRSEWFWLSWLGPIEAEFFLGVLDGHVTPNNPRFLGMRIGVEPLPGLEIELLRTAQYGGDGRDNSFSAFTDALLAAEDETGTFGNQLAGIGISKTWWEEVLPLRTYVQAVGEDEAGNLPSCWFYLAGLEGRFQSGRVKSSLSLEATDTRVDFTQHGFCGPNTAYNNSHFAQGYTHSGVVLGAPIDSEGSSLVLYGEHEFAPFELSWSIGAYRINQAAQAENRLSSTRVDGEMVSLTLSRAWNHLEMDVYIAHQGFDLNSAGLAQGFRLGLGARVVF